MAASCRRRLLSLNVQGTHKIHFEAKALRCSSHLALLWRERLQLSQKLRNFCQANEATAARVDLKRQFGLAGVGENEVALIEKGR